MTPRLKNRALSGTPSSPLPGTGHYFFWTLSSIPQIREQFGSFPAQKNLVFFFFVFRDNVSGDLPKLFPKFLVYAMVWRVRMDVSPYKRRSTQERFRHSLRTSPALLALILGVAGIAMWANGTGPGLGMVNANAETNARPNELRTSRRGEYVVEGVSYHLLRFSRVLRKDARETK